MSNALFSTAEQRALGFSKLFKKLSPETQHWWTDTYPETINKWQAQIFTEEERARLTWCFLLVTEPTHHDNAEGLAAALVNPWYSAVSEKGQLVGLATADESAANRYKAIGFRERGRTVIEGPTGKLPCILLSRE
ncbi:hypothetical protein OF83DRAFT_705952 [Amylostereum chailletii]|nr:hypothetical protein OF83DRAFT_705952 [Amylostereum chailletii]